MLRRRGHPPPQSAGVGGVGRWEVEPPPHPTPCPASHVLPGLTKSPELRLLWRQHGHPCPLCHPDPCGPPLARMPAGPARTSAARLGVQTAGLAVLPAPGECAARPHPCGSPLGAHPVSPAVPYSAVTRGPSSHGPSPRTPCPPRHSHVLPPPLSGPWTVSGSVWARGPV